MSEYPHPIYKVLHDDERYSVEAYQFVREALSYAQDVLGLGVNDSLRVDDVLQAERHLSGQQLCEASRLYALQQFGLMAKTVLATWGIRTTDDLGEIVYNLIKVDLMKKSDNDRREDFDSVFDFESGLTQAFQFTAVDELELL